MGLKRCDEEADDRQSPKAEEPDEGRQPSLIDNEHHALREAGIGCRQECKDCGNPQPDPNKVSRGSGAAGSSSGFSYNLHSRTWRPDTTLALRRGALPALTRSGPPQS
jgi:hypothetical protein